MIEENALLTVRRGFPRPSPKQVAAFAKALTGNLTDCMGGRGAMDRAIRPIIDVPRGYGRFCGVAVTCATGPGDNLAIFAAIDAAKAGDVIVVAADGFTGVAVVGDLVLGMAANRGVKAMVIDGMARDVEGMLKVGIPAFARGITPNSCDRSGPGTAGLPVTAGGVRVESGDVVVGDYDGVVVIPQAQLAAVAAKLKTVLKLEAELERKVKAGLDVPDFYKALVKKGAVREIG